MDAKSESRSERRKRVTHATLVDATAELLLEVGPHGVTSRSVADRADVAVGTFYNHFDSIDDALEAVLADTREWARSHAARILTADNYQDAVSAWVADFLRRLEADGREFRLARAAGLPVLGNNESAHIIAAMRDRWGSMWADRGIKPGTAGPVMLRIMCLCGDLYGGQPMSEGTAEHLARILHATNTNDATSVDEQVRLTLAHWHRLGARETEPAAAGR